VHARTYCFVLFFSQRSSLRAKRRSVIVLSLARSSHSAPVRVYFSGNWNFLSSLGAHGAEIVDAKHFRSYYVFSLAALFAWVGDFCESRGIQLSGLFNIFGAESDALQKWRFKGSK